MNENPQPSDEAIRAQDGFEMLLKEQRDVLEVLAWNQAHIENEIRNKTSIILGMEVTLETNLQDLMSLDVPAYIRNALWSRDIRTIGQLIVYSESQLLRQRNIGPQAIIAIKNFLSKHGYALLDDAAII